MLRRSSRLLSGNPALPGQLLRERWLCGANFRTAQPRRHFGGRRLVKRALAHGNFGNRFVDRSVPNVFRICRGRADNAALFVRRRVLRSGAQVAIGAA
jgi:hypothetical protein